MHTHPHWRRYVLRVVLPLNGGHGAPTKLLPRAYVIRRQVPSPQGATAPRTRCWVTHWGWPLARQEGGAVQHVLCVLQINNPHDHLRLEQGVGQLGVVQQQLACLLRVVLNAPLHLLHQLKHLLRGKAGHCLSDGLRGRLRGHWGPVQGRLGGATLTHTTHQHFKAPL